VWGDADSGYVTDRVYVSTAALHVLEFELAPGGGFRHSGSNKTVFAADVFYRVLDGTLVLADPQHGEVRIVEAGEGVLFRRDTWHHGFNPAAESVRVLEFFAPPPSKGTASSYSVNQPDLASPLYHDARWDRRWPMGTAEREAVSKLHVVGESSALWRFAHDAPSHLQGTLVDTEHLLVRTGRVAAGHVEDLHEVADETVLVVTSGQLWVDTRDDCGDFSVACLEPGDGVFVPAGSSLRALVRSSTPATYLWGAGRLTPDDWAP
jgi:mannose-6-phosphate isomerase-like protein (cupin superfamily)